MTHDDPDDDYIDNTPDDWPRRPKRTHVHCQPCCPEDEESEPEEDIPTLYEDAKHALYEVIRATNDTEGTEEAFAALIDAAIARTPADQVEDRFGFYHRLLPLHPHYLDDIYNYLISDND